MILLVYVTLGGLTIWWNMPDLLVEYFDSEAERTRSHLSYEYCWLLDPPKNLLVRDANSAKFLGSGLKTWSCKFYCFLPICISDANSYARNDLLF